MENRTERRREGGVGWSRQITRFLLRQSLPFPPPFPPQFSSRRPSSQTFLFPGNIPSDDKSKGGGRGGFIIHLCLYVCVFGRGGRTLGGGIRVGAKFPWLRPPSLSRPFIYATLLFLSQQLLLRWHFQIRPAPTPDLLLFGARRERTLNYRTSF